MSNLTITIEAPQLAAAVKQLADAIATANADKGETEAVKVFFTEEAKRKEALGDILQTAFAEEWSEPEEKPAKEEPKPAPAAETHYTVEQVRESLGKLSQAKGKAVARGILSQIGVKSVSDLQPDQFALAMRLIEGAA